MTAMPTARMTQSLPSLRVFSGDAGGQRFYRTRYRALAFAGRFEPLKRAGSGGLDPSQGTLRGWKCALAERVGRMQVLVNEG